MKKILILDNYDSFTYNLYQYVGEIMEDVGEKFIVDVKKNDEISLTEIIKNKYGHIIISPGPGSPVDKKYFGVCAEILQNYSRLGIKIKVLGVCLGLQGIAHYFGGKVVRAKLPMHGKTSSIRHDKGGVFKNLPQNLEIMRYHSLIVDRKSLPKELRITAVADEEIMGLRHRKFPIEGIQFHPESFSSEGGKQILINFLS